MRVTLKSPKPAQSLKGVRILSLSPNLPGPAALQRCRQMGATCIKIEPPAPTSLSGSPVTDGTGDPMSAYSPTGYRALHQGVRVLIANLKTDAGQKMLRRELAKAQVLLTSFRPSALTKLGLDWRTLHSAYPQLSMVAIFGDSGAHAEHPGHDLTYMAQAGLLTGLELPATLYADMAGSLMASEAILQAVLLQRQKNRGHWHEVSLTAAATHLAQPHIWGSMAADTLLGGGHAGYRIYPCLDGRVALAALEPHFARSLCLLAGVAWTDFGVMLVPATRQAIAEFVSKLSRQALEALSQQHDIPLHTLP
ncbi:MAG: CoA transferase [Comamonadaceae bacterium]|nr:CoA transferase [Comamonadaceae bacterium]